MRPFLLALLVGAAVGFQPGTAKCVHQLSASAPNAQTPCSPLLRHKNNDKRSPLSNFSKKKGALMLSSGGAQAESESPLKKLLSTNKPFIAASMLVVLDIFFRRLLESLAISFPSSLAGCGIMFATFLIAPGGDKLYQLLSPGAALLAKWLPVFFVPSLITLPLADSVGSVSELLKIAAVIVGGFYFTLLSTAYTVVGVRKVLTSRKGVSEDSTQLQEKSNESSSQPTPQSPPPKPFSDEINNSLRMFTVASGIAAVISKQLGGALATPLSAFFMLGTTLSTFVFGARLPKRFVKIVHPLVTCTTLTWAVAYVFAKIAGSTFRSMLKGYRTNSLSLLSAGAGDILIFLLGPAVISLACQMYDRRKLMRENIAEVGAGVGVSAFGGVFGTAAAVRFLQIASPYLRLSLLSRNITSPLAMAIAGILGADVSLAVSFVVITGLIGANFGANILDSFGIKDAVARGLGIGAAAHGLGTAAFVNEEDTFPFAAISMALTASAVTVIVSVPLFKRLILQLALGY